jgi:hypothetical protein
LCAFDFATPNSLGRNATIGSTVDIFDAGTERTLPMIRTDDEID